MKRIEAMTADILLVEDNPGDVRLTKEALKDAKVLNEIYVAKDGVEAMEFYKQKRIICKRAYSRPNSA